MPRFDAMGAKIIGVSSDSSESHARFAGKYDLPFSLLSDKGGRIRKMYGATGLLMGLIPGRVTYVIDREGVIRHVFSSQTAFRGHIEEALRALPKA
jgi:peroxiredoxin Q/BCP